MSKLMTSTETNKLRLKVKSMEKEDCVKLVNKLLDQIDWARRYMEKK